MPDDPPTEPAVPPGGPRGAAVPADAPARRQAVIVAGHRADEATARAGLDDPDPSVRAAALGALGRMGRLGTDQVLAALEDRSATVRRRAVQEAATLGTDDDPVTAALRAALGDRDPLVVEQACWALGERGATSAVDLLAETARAHTDTRCREAAVAALGAIGDDAGLPAVLGSLTDKPTVRRRAVVALAAFDGPEVDGALRAALADRDWQVRQAAEILLDDSPSDDGLSDDGLSDGISRRWRTGC